MIAIARRVTINGVPYFCQAGLKPENAWSTTLGAVAGDGMVAGAGEVAICILVLLESLVLSHLTQIGLPNSHHPISVFQRIASIPGELPPIRASGSRIERQASLQLPLVGLSMFLAVLEVPFFFVLNVLASPSPGQEISV
jgi:hypothetical protein